MHIDCYTTTPENFKQNSNNNIPVKKINLFMHKLSATFFTSESDLNRLACSSHRRSPTTWKIHCPFR